MMRLWCLLLLGVACLPVQQALAEGGVRGRVAWRGELIQGITVRAYHEIADIATNKVVATSAPTDLDGLYHLPLKPGSYVLTASNLKDGALRPGDYFCYYSGSPIQVTAEGERNVGFNLIKVPVEAPALAADRSGLTGELTYQGEPLERAYLYVYKEPDKGFKGPGYFIQPVAKGSFRLNLPPGEYYLLARKRERGGQFGPIEIGDFFNYYHGNPVRIAPGQVREVKIETITRLSMLEEDVVVFHGVRGQVVNVAGQPQAKMYVFAYRSPEMTGTPDFFSATTGKDGWFELALPDAGPYYLLARQAFGGPAGEGELYGRLLTADGRAVAVAPQEKPKEVRIHVAPKDAR